MKKKPRFHFLNGKLGELPTKCLKCGCGVVVCCEKLFRKMTKDDVRDKGGKD